MIIFTRLPDYLRSKYDSWKGATGTYDRKTWLDRAERSEEYFYNDVENTGTTYTVEQRNNIRENTNLPVSINYLYPVLAQKLALLANTKPSTRVVSLDGRAKQQAFVLDKMKHGVFYTSDARMQVENHIKDCLISGMGHLMITPSDYYRPGLFGTNIIHVPYDEIILDINARQRDCSDMEGFFVEKEFTIPKALQLYGDIMSQLRHESGRVVNIRELTDETFVENDLTEKARAVTVDYNTTSRIRVREFYEKVYTTKYLIQDPQTGETKYEFAENLDVEGQAILESAIDANTGIYIKRTTILGDFQVDVTMLPISEYPLVTTFFEWGGKPYRSYGMIHYTRDMQDAFDKAVSIMIMNGILQNNAGWRAPKGSIQEEDRIKWEKYGNDPRVIKEYEPRVFDEAGAVLVPERDQVQGLSNFYPILLEMLKSGIEYSTGITPVVSGIANETNVEVFSSLQQYQNAAMQRVQMTAAHLNETMKNLGQVLIEYMISGLNPGDYQFFDENGDLTELSIAQNITTELRKYKYQVVSIPSTAMPTQRMAASTELMKIAQSSPDPSERQVLTQKAMELADIKEYDDVRENLDTVKNTQQQLQQLQGAYDRLTETSKQMENRLINTSIENEKLKRMLNLVEDAADAQATIRTMKQQETSKIKDQQKPKSASQ